MRKLFGMIFIVMGCLFGVVSLWSVKGLLTEDTSEAVVVADCKRQISEGLYSGENAMGRCVEDGWKAVGMVDPVYIIGILLFGFLSLFFIILGRRLYRKTKQRRPFRNR